MSSNSPVSTAAREKYFHIAGSSLPEHIWHAFGLSNHQPKPLYYNNLKAFGSRF